jgi:hypothetical protein
MFAKFLAVLCSPKRRLKVENPSPWFMDIFDEAVGLGESVASLVDVLVEFSEEVGVEGFHGVLLSALIFKLNRGGVKNQRLIRILDNRKFLSWCMQFISYCCGIKGFKCLKKPPCPLRNFPLDVICLFCR